jgi:chromosome segregation ATPase
MKHFILKNKKALTGTLAFLLIGAMTMSFQDSPFGYSKYLERDALKISAGCADTIPDKEFTESMKMKDFDKLQSELDRTLKQVDAELRKIDLTGIEKQIESSLKSVDMEKIMKDVELSLKSIDMDKMMADISSSLKDIDLKHNSAEIEKALAEAKKEIENAKLEIKDIDKAAMKKEMANAEKEIEKARAEIKKIDLDKIMDEARAGIDKAKAELKLTKEMFTELEKDGLINSRKGFSIEYKNKDLFINGKKQPEKVTDKYRKYFKEDPYKITIDKD